MGGGRWVSALLLGLLCLLSGALTSGDAEEETSHPPTDSFAPTATPLPMSVSSGVSGPPNATSEPPGSDIIAETKRPSPPPLSTVSSPESDGAESSVTAAPRGATGASDEMASDPSRTPPVTDSYRATSADATEPPAPTQPPSAAHNVTAETPSLLATLRTSAAAKTQPGSDPTLYTTTSMSVHSTWTSAITTSLFITTTVTSQEPRSPATQSATAAPHTTRAEVQREPSVLEVGDGKDLTGYPSRSSSNPLFVMIVSVFTVMVVMVVVVVGFHRYKKRNNRTEFRRLQDLPMVRDGEQRAASSITVPASNPPDTDSVGNRYDTKQN